MNHTGIPTRSRPNVLDRGLLPAGYACALLFCAHLYRVVVSGLLQPAVHESGRAHRGSDEAENLLRVQVGQVRILEVAMARCSTCDEMASKVVSCLLPLAELH